MVNTTNFPTLREGSRGDEVIKLQEVLKQLNFYSGVTDGIFGVQTKDAVVRFQNAYGLIADGIVGSNTWSKLNEVAGTMEWRRMTEAEEVDEIKRIINNRMGVAALNLLALESFLGLQCTRSFYFNEKFGGNQRLMRVKCDPPRGASSAVAYEEIRIIFNLFEGFIETFNVERVIEGTEPKFKLPD
ncbi:peptidoglycan-binding protein [Mastigocoleus testarum BC008]|uniref:Peptidoglycan-binding protein n=1 Tax=Mastigocoleus testarum BC008 TaxID=371196 RepID=A0A0V7ZWN4_9CYAN|nr:peptidoglycan-binding protein [Mastigocoleus testarum BC008]